MTEWNDYQVLFKGIEAIPKDQIEIPKTKIVDFCYETERLYKTVQKDQKRLTEFGLTPDMINTLPLAIKALRFAEANYLGDEKTILETEWENEVIVAREIEEQVVEALWYSCRNDLVLLMELQELKEKSLKNNVPISQVLNEIVGFAIHHSDRLHLIQFSMDTVTELIDASDRLEELHQLIDGRLQFQNRSELFRNKAYTFLCRIADEISAAGTYLFYSEEKHRDEYFVHH